MAQVKFYSVSALPQSPSEGNLYFVNGGELYKGSQRFGANKIFTAAAGASNLTEATAGITGAIGGDILTGFSATKIYTGNASATPSWVDVGQDQAALDEQLKALVSSLAFASDSGLYITGITQDEITGEVTAHTSTFATDVKNTIGDGSASSVANGITVSVVTTSGSVTSVSVEAANLDVTSITAGTGTFTNLTVGGSTIGEWISASTTDAVTSTGTSLPTESAVYDFVTTQISSLDNAMHFVGAGTTLPASAEAGDVYVFTADATDNSGYKSGQEVVYTGSAWEVIGDQNSYAINAYTSTASLYTGVTNVPGALDVIGAEATTWYSKAQIGKSSAALYGLEATISLYSGSAPTITLTGSTVATTAADILSDASVLVTASAVYAFVDNKLDDIEWSSTSTSNANGVTVTMEVVDSDTKSATIGLEIVTASTATDVSDSNKASNLVTAAAVSAYVAQEIEGLDATVQSSMTGVFVSVTEENGKLTGMTVSVAASSEMNYGATGSADELATTAAVATFFNNNLVWLGDSDQPINA